ncbi:hypothetical protein ACNTMW_13460 [Planosporangium sp. 12N6]|uniref:hypothetical protein n=1 Tax=Planosporangium spinosum TaxID=3402278 RepID=UPI003CED8B2D
MTVSVDTVEAGSRCRTPDGVPALRRYSATVRKPALPIEESGAFGGGHDSGLGGEYGIEGWSACLADSSLHRRR